MSLHSQNPYVVHILSAPSVFNPLCYTEKRLWVENYPGFEFVHKLILATNKGLLEGDYLIDDYIAGRGQENFDGECPCCLLPTSLLKSA